MLPSKLQHDQNKNKLRDSKVPERNDKKAKPKQRLTGSYFKKLT